MKATKTQTNGRESGEMNFITAETNTKTCTTPAALKEPPLPSQKRKAVRGLLLAAMVLATSAAVFLWWRVADHWVSTNNAYIAGHIHAVSSRLAGNVSEVLVVENQQVAAGDVLARLDTSDLELQCEKARAALAQAKAQRVQIHALVTRDESVATKAEADFARTDKLFHDPSATLSRQEFDNAQAALEVARASLNATKAAVLAADAQVEAATAQLADVELQLSYTTIVAPAAGRIGRKNIEVGNRVQPGQALLAVVQSEVWITANFKETEIARLEPGQRVKVSLDGFPGQPFIGRVESLAPASGAQFALLPPDNATGNFTKIVQRVPVKIVFDAASVRGFDGRIVPGMSVNVKVNVRS